MSFLNKIKQGLGIGTMDAKLNIPGQVAGSSGKVEGDFTLTAKSDQKIKDVKVKFELVRQWDETKHRRDSNGRDETYTSHETQSYDLGNFTDNAPFEMKSGETKTIHFTIPFQPFDPKAVAGGAGLSGVVGAIAMFAAGQFNERYEYKVEGKVDLEGVAFDPKDIKDVYIV